MSKLVKDYVERSLIFIATCPEIFGGYGLTAVGRSRAEAIDALWVKYKEVSKDWNESGQQCIDYSELTTEWRVDVRLCKLGEGYFGDDEYNKKSSHDKVSVHYVGNREADDDANVQAIASGLSAAHARLDLLEQREDEERCKISEDNLKRFIELLEELGNDELESLATKASNRSDDALKMFISPSVSALLNSPDA
jgi:hypothetical protein